MSGQRTLLIVALGVPVASAIAFAAPRQAQKAAVALVASAVAWGALVIDGGRITWGWLYVDALVAAACCGAVLLAVAARSSGEAGPRRLGSAVVAVTLGVAVGVGGGPIFVLVVSLSLVVLSAAAPTFDRLTSGGQTDTGAASTGGFVAAAASTAGVLCLGLGGVLVHGETDRWALPQPGVATLPNSAVTALALGAVLLAVAGVAGGRGPYLVLTAAGAAVALRSVSLAESGEADGIRWLAVVVVAGSAAAALVRRPALALVLFGVGAALADPLLVPAGSLIVAAGILAEAVGRPPALYASVPGAVALVLAASGSGDDFAIGIAVVGGAVAALIARSPAGASAPTAAAERETAGPRSLDPAEAPALVAIVWLSVAPGSWGWVGDAGLSAYDAGAARAAAAGSLAVVLAAAWAIWRTGDPQLVGSGHREP